MAQLPNINTSDRVLSMLQSQYSAILNPVLANPVTNPKMLKNIKLIAGDTKINHLLQQMQQGYIIIDLNAAAKIYRSQPFNDLTLTLTSDTACTVSLLVF